MSKELDLSKMESWSDEEASFNYKYLFDRGRHDEARQVAEKFGFDTSPLGSTGGGTILESTPQASSTFGTSDKPAEPGSSGTEPQKVGPFGPNSDQQSTAEEADDDDEAEDEDPATWVKSTSVDEVLEWVGDDQERAQFAKDAEASKGRRARSTLIEGLDSVLEDEDEEEEE